MNNNFNGYYYPYNNMRNIPNMNFSRSIPNTYYGAGPATRSAGGLLSRLFPGIAGASGATTSLASGAATSGITFTGILNGASKTLGVINQAIPVFYQMKPMWNNAKTIFRVAKAMNSSDSNSSTSNTTNTTTSNTNNFTSSNEPTFFN